MVGPGGRGKKTGVGGIGSDESGLEISAGFIIRLADHRADRRDDASARCSKAFHPGDRGVGDAGKRSPPSRMSGADDARRRVGEQHRRAIRRRNPDGKAWRSRHEGVSARTVSGGPRCSADTASAEWI